MIAELVSFIAFIGLLLAWMTCTLFVRWISRPRRKRVSYEETTRHFSVLVRQHGGWDEFRKHCYLNRDGVYVYDPPPPPPPPPPIKPALLASHEKNLP